MHTPFSLAQVPLCFALSTHAAALCILVMHVHGLCAKCKSNTGKRAFAKLT